MRVITGFRKGKPTLRSKQGNLLRTGCVAVLLMIAAGARAQEQQDYDAYTIRFDGLWFYSQPSGTFTSTGNRGILDLHRDMEFHSYSTGLAKLDWKFTRKNHLYFIYTDFNHSKDNTLNRTVTFQGQTFNVGAAASGSLRARVYMPSYQYDIIRRKRGSLSLQVQLNIIDTGAKLSTAAQVNNGVPQAANFASGQIRLPLPVAGPKLRYFLVSDKLFVDANVLGMYFFGYGHYVSTMGTLGFNLTKHVAIGGGYTISSRFDITTRDNRIGVSLSQQGGIAGLEFSF